MSLERAVGRGGGCGCGGAGQGAITLGDVPEPFVDVNDIADVAVAALNEDSHDGQIYELTEPRCLTFTEAVGEIASATGREIHYIQIPHEAFAAGIAESGAPDDISLLNLESSVDRYVLC